MASKGKKAPAKKKANGYEQPKHIPPGTIIVDQSKNEWKIGKSIGCGGFGEIYSAVKAQSSIKSLEDYPFVVKIEPHGNGPLFVEMHFYMRNAKLEDIESFKQQKKLKALGMPHFVGSGSHDQDGVKHRFVVMPRYGRDLWSIFLENERKLPLPTVYRVALQMLDVLEYIHGRTYVHADLKGANILLEFVKGQAAQLYLVDFGLASHYTTKDFKPDPKKMHNGTIEYTSRDAHNGVPTMRSDMEILAYNLIEWCGATLPWAKLITNPVKVQQSKEEHMKKPDTMLAACFKSVPPPIKDYVAHVTSLKYDQTPDYKLCRNIFEKGLKDEGKPNSGALEFRAISVPVAGPSRNKSPIKAVKTRESAPSRSSPRGKREQIDLDESSSPEIVVAKRPRQDETKKNKVAGKVPKVENGSGDGDHASDIVVNNAIKSSKKSKKVYEFNLELDVSIDADVIVNVKRKKKGGSEKSKPKEQSPIEDDGSEDDGAEAEVPESRRKKKSPVLKVEAPQKAVGRTPAAVGRAGEYKGKKAKNT